MSATANPPAGILPDPDAPPLTPADRAIVEAAAKAILAAAVEAAARD